MGDSSEEDMKMPIQTDQRGSRGTETRQMKGAIIIMFCVMLNVNKDRPEGAE